MNKKTGRFLTGLLPEVQLALNYFKVPYEINDERKQLEFVYESIDKDFLKQWTPKGSEPLELYDYQVDLVNQAIKHKRGIVKAPTAAGKAQPIDSIIYTPDGPKTMGEIEVGDIVCTPDGNTAKVLGIYPQGKIPVYRITFSNGDTVECCKEHLWLVDSIRNQWKSNKVKSTDYLLKNFLDKQGKPNLRIHPSSAVFFNKKEISINPYLLGVLLGDGHLSKNSITISNVDALLLNKIRNIINDDYHLKFNNKCDWRLVKKSSRCGGKGWHENIYVNHIRKYGLDGKRSWEKFIPRDYMYNSKEIRLELLNGLLDTDGYIDKKGRLSYTTTSEQLQKDFKELVESLGGICRVTTCYKKYKYKGIKKIGRLAHIITFYFPNPEQLFNVEFKKSRIVHKRTHLKSRVIKSFEKIGEKDCVCILVDHKDHMYVTNNFIPTHNTAIMISILKALPPNTPTLFLVNRKLLVSQNYKEMIKWGLENVGRFNSDHHEPNVITCANVQSLHYLDRLLPKFKVLVTDEVHMMSNNTGIRAFKKLTGTSIRIAVSATPFKFGEKDHVQKYTVKGYFGPLFEIDSGIDGKLNTALLQDRGMLSDSICKFYPIDEPQIPYDIWMDAVTNGIANNFHFHKIVTRLAGKLDGRTLILVDRIAHGDALSNLIPDSLWVRGEDNEKTREYVIERLQSEKNKVVAIATRQIFDTGINFFVHNIINATDTSSEHGVIQLTGRGLRKADDKSILNYYDFIYRINPYLENHSNDRIKILKKEKHEVVIMDSMDF
jgi:superfamily II DNA or RNA helicase